MTDIDPTRTRTSGPAMDARIRVCVVEQRPLARDCIARLLADEFVVTCAEPTPAAPEWLDTQRARAVVVGADVGAAAWPTLLAYLPAIAERCPTVIVGCGVDKAMHARAMQLGVMGIVTWDQPGDVLMKAMRKVAAGELWLDRSSTARLVADLRTGSDADRDQLVKVQTLTPRERQVVDLITEGLSNERIAGRLAISQATVRNHLTSVLDKLDLDDRFQLAVFAFRRGLVSYPWAAAARA